MLDKVEQVVYSAGPKLAENSQHATVSGMILFGVPLSDAVLVLSGIFTAAQFAYRIYDKFIKDHK